jgi:hypothetical protein
LSRRGSERISLSLRTPITEDLPSAVVY